MKRKFLIVYKEGSLRDDVKCINEVIKEFGGDAERFSTPHKEALDVFQELNPDVIIICDYTDDVYSRGFKTYHKFASCPATLQKTIIRIGASGALGDFKRGYLEYPLSSKHSKMKLGLFRDELRSYIQP